jgi:hypothetical protein
MPLLALLPGLLFFLQAPGAAAQDFFRVSPGDLTESHSKWDNDAGCTQCHELGGGVTNDRCLGCHDHQKLKQAIAEGKGLHAQHKDRCTACHTEHQGKNRNITDWKPVGGRKDFNHRLTGFALTGKHGAIACTACHKQRLKSGRVSYLGRSQNCTSCHGKVHRFTRSDLKSNCKLCHPSGTVSRQMTPEDTPFDHLTIGVDLVGKHKSTRCNQCHRAGNMPGRSKARTCKNCHRNPHGRAFAGKNCAACHRPDRRWNQPTAESPHNRAGWPLRGRHRKVKCASCHRANKMKVSKRCASCHRDPHRGRFTKRQCEDCHHLAGKDAVRFDHLGQTEFALLGRHQKLGCRDCHRGRSPRRFEEFKTFKTQGCSACHAHRNAHSGQFKNKPCATCHREGGRRTESFDHDRDTRYPLTGRHRQLGQKGRCDLCHPGGVYQTGKLACADCHQEPHRGQLGKDCARCHSPEVRFDKTSMDPDSHKRFPLTGAHRQVGCQACHPDGRYRLGPISCYRCHAATDPHRGRLGKQCEQCHIPDRGAPKFDHQSMTRFARTGAHQKTHCSFCHRKTEPDALPPPVGWTREQQPQKLDLGFPVMGTTCSDCHRDIHDGRYGENCESCHNSRSFKEIKRAVHDSGPFRLEGVHTQLACQRCHREGLSMAGLGDQCQACHREDDVHQNSLGPECGKCHSQRDWLPPRFRHAETGFVLRGAHRTARCRDCHSLGFYSGLPTDCAFCHQADAARVTEPVHTGELNDCDSCHRQNSFSPARVLHVGFPLRGAHKFARCSGCHPAGTYAGTSDECGDCHLQQYQDPGNKPDHLAAGFSTRCEDCHTPTSWIPARYRHSSFRLRGFHRTLQCRNCHPGNDYNGALGGLDWDCINCHGPGGPIDRWPPDHTTRGNPTNCDLCHNQSAWVPARQPP